MRIMSTETTGRVSLVSVRQVGAARSNAVHRDLSATEMLPPRTCFHTLATRSQVRGIPAPDGLGQEAIRVCALPARVCAVATR